jgi:hypothetical protein
MRIVPVIFSVYCFLKENTYVAIIATMITLLPCKTVLAHAPTCPDVLRGISNNEVSKDKDLYLLEDDAGVAAICKEFFPSFGERMTFWREMPIDFAAGKDKIILKLKKEYCWFREIFTKEKNCAVPWGVTREVHFNISKDSMGPANAQDIVGIFSKVFIDYKLDSKGVFDPRFICAYQTSSILNLVEAVKYFDPLYAPVIDMYEGVLARMNKLGCIQMPLRTLPVYNKTLVPQKTVISNSSIPEGSTFETPKIILNVVNVDNEISMDKRDTATLTYDYSNKTAQCKELLGKRYCPKISDKKKICAYLQSNNYVVGCVPRPSPKDSGFKFDVKHFYYYDSKCRDKNNNTVPFHSIKIKMTRPDNTSVIFPKDKSLREYYACYDKDSQNDYKYTAKKDSIEIYDVVFGAVIPKFIDRQRRVFATTKYLPPISYDLDANAFSSNAYKKSCDACYSPVAWNDTAGEELIVPAGSVQLRDRDSCKVPHKCMSMKEKGKEKQTCLFGYQDKYNEIEQSLCYGVYRINQVENKEATHQKGKKLRATEADQICMHKLNDDWPNFFLGTQKGDRYCVNIPSYYEKLDITNVSRMTKFVDFTNDGFKLGTKYSNKKKFVGQCRAEFGLEPEKNINTKIFDKLNISARDKLMLSSKVEAIQDNLNSISANVASISHKQSSVLGFNKLDEIMADSSGEPTRQLDGNVPIGNIAYGCRFISGHNGCGENTETAEFLGYGYFKMQADDKSLPEIAASGFAAAFKYDAGTLENIEDRIKKKLAHKDYNIGDVLTTASKNQLAVDTGSNLKILRLKVSGKCKDGYTSADYPKRICRVLINSANNKIITKAWEDTEIESPCVPN